MMTIAIPTRKFGALIQDMTGELTSDTIAFHIHDQFPSFLDFQGNYVRDCVTMRFSDDEEAAWVKLKHG